MKLTKDNNKGDNIFKKKEGVTLLVLVTIIILFLIVLSVKLEQKIFKYNEDKEDKSKIKIVITSIKYDIRKDIIINYTKDDKSFKTVIERY